MPYGRQVYNLKEEMLYVTFGNRNYNQVPEATHHRETARQVREVYEKFKGDFNLYYVKKCQDQQYEEERQRSNPQAPELLRQHDARYPNWYNVRDFCGAFIQLRNTTHLEDYTQPCSFTTIYVDYSRNPRLVHDIMTTLLGWSGLYIENMDVGLLYPTEEAIQYGPCKAFLLKHRDNPYGPFLEFLRHQDYTFDRGGGKTTVYGVLGAAPDPLSDGSKRTLLVTNDMRGHVRYLHEDYSDIQYSDHVQDACRDKRFLCHLCHFIDPVTVHNLVVRVNDKRVMIRPPHRLLPEEEHVRCYTDVLSCVNAVVHSLFPIEPVPTTPCRHTHTPPTPDAPSKKRHRRVYVNSETRRSKARRRLFYEDMTTRRRRRMRSSSSSSQLKN